MVVFAATLQQTATSKVWLHLLHFDTPTSTSNITTQSFFLSPDGNRNPESELRATLQHYKQDKTMVCRYPARYLFLEQQGLIDGYEKSYQKCKGVRQKIAKLQATSLSVVYVSGYMKNPASTFGHTFLKVNSTKKQSELFDTTFSFGALVPEHENAFLYVVRGVSGLYEASFRDRYFFTHDMVYSNTEQRDMWEYELNIPKNKINFLLLHLLELQNVHLKYYFFKRNCAYEVNYLLSMLGNEKLLPKWNLWYTPVESFIAYNNNKGYIKKIHYYSSKQKQIYRHYSSCSKKQQKEIGQIVANKEKLAEVLEPLMVEEKTAVLDFLLQYTSYKIASLPKSKQTSYNRFKKELILWRLRYPPTKQSKKEPEVQPLISPEKSIYPTFVSLGGGYNQTKGSYVALGFGGFDLSSTNFNSLEGDQLSVLKGTIGFSHNKSFIQKFQLLHLRKFARNPLEFEPYNLTWELQVGVNNLNEEKSVYDYFANYAAGSTYYIYSLALAPLVEFSLHSKSDKARVAPKVVARGGYGRFKTVMSLGYEFGYDAVSSTVYEFSFCYTFNSSFALSAEFEKRAVAKQQGHFGLEFHF